jgi:hypothetical protein
MTAKNRANFQFAKFLKSSALQISPKIWIFIKNLSANFLKTLFHKASLSQNIFL